MDDTNSAAAPAPVGARVDLGAVCADDGSRAGIGAGNDLAQASQKAPSMRLPDDQGRFPVTREHKLALILGFSILLLVGVLVGDHFSKARTTRSPGDVASVNPGVLVEPERVPPAPRLQMAQTPTQTPAPVVPAPSPGNTGGDEMVNGLSPAAAQLQRELTMGGPVSPPAVTIVRTPTSPELGLTPPAAPQLPAPAPAPGPTGLPMATEPTISHPVTAEDSLYRLAKRYYNDANLWEKLAEFNKGRIRGRDGLSVGVTLLIPPKSVLLGKAAPAGNGPATAPIPKPAVNNSVPAPAPGPAGSASPVGATSEYQVQPGDTLSTISLKTLGTSKRWREIRDLNKSAIPDDLTLKIGQKLKIPARAAR